MVPSAVILANLTEEKAIRRFIETWCHVCEIAKLTNPNLTLADINPLCPPETLSSCPQLAKINLLRQATQTQAVGPIQNENS